MSVKRNSAWFFLAVLALSAICGVAFAGVSAEEAEHLKTTLTPFGAERAGNSGGTIPEWTGGLTSFPPGGTRENLFPNEKPLFSITAKNMDQYGGKLSPIVKAMLKKYPATYRLDVYPTHRTNAGPEWLYESMFKNATRAKLEDGGYSFSNAVGGAPFPIPKSGIEVQWNHQARWQGEARRYYTSNYVMTTGGNRILTGKFIADQDFPYNYKGMTYEKLMKDYRGKILAMNTSMVAPPDQVGSMTGGEIIVNPGKARELTYQYLVGQRRVRLAPNVAFDAPSPGNNGSTFVDESWTYAMSPEKYDWKLVGKREMYIPYNNNNTVYLPLEKTFLPHHLNPDGVRWELHRVWVVEATLRAGKRHLVPRRTFYADEDTWLFSLCDMYDGQGRLWKGHVNLVEVVPSLPGVVLAEDYVYNVQTWDWTEVGNNPKERGDVPPRTMARRPMSYYSPSGMASQGVR